MTQDICSFCFNESGNWNYPSLRDCKESQLELVRNLRLGDLLNCRDCGQPIYRNAKGEYRFIDADDELFFAWCDKECALSTEHIEALKGIGKIRNSADDIWSICIGCSVTLKSGDVIEKAIVALGRDKPWLPFRREDFKELILGCEVSEIKPSDYAVSAEVHYAAEKIARATGHGEFTSFSKTKDGHLVTLDDGGQIDFYEANGTMGKDLMPCNKTPDDSFYRGAYGYRNNHSDVTWVVFDWFDDAVETLVQLRD